MAISSEILFFHTFFAKRSEMIDHIRHRCNRTIKTPIERVRTDKQVEKRKCPAKETYGWIVPAEEPKSQPSAF